MHHGHAVNLQTLLALSVTVVYDSTPWLPITVKSGQCFTEVSQATQMIGKLKQNTGPDVPAMDKSETEKLFNLTVISIVQCRENTFQQGPLSGMLQLEEDELKGTETPL